MLPENYRGLYAIVDLAFEDRIAPEELTEIFIDNDIKIIQLRAKKVTSRHFLDVARRMRKIIPDDFVFIVNDRPDIALLVGADGVHVGQDDIYPQLIKENWNFVTGLSTHNLEQVKEASSLNVDYIGFGPIYPTTSKDKPDPVVGVGLLEKAVAISPHPVVAIGGIDEKRLGEILDRVCPRFFSVVSYIALADNPSDVVRRLQGYYESRCGK